MWKLLIMLHLWMDIVLLSRHPASIHRPVHRFSETVYQPVPNPDGPVILVLVWVESGPVWTHMKEKVVHWFVGSTREKHGGRKPV